MCCAAPTALWRNPLLLRARLQVNNVAELLLVRGLAQVVRHRGDEERSGALVQWPSCGQSGMVP